MKPISKSRSNSFENRLPTFLLAHWDVKTTHCPIHPETQRKPRLLCKFCVAIHELEVLYTTTIALPVGLSHYQAKRWSKTGRTSAQKWTIHKKEQIECTCAAVHASAKDSAHSTNPTLAWAWKPKITVKERNVYVQPTWLINESEPQRNKQS